MIYCIYHFEDTIEALSHRYFFKIILIDPRKISLLLNLNHEGVVAPICDDPGLALSILWCRVGLHLQID